MCSEGVSVWFACKLCPSFFLNADDFAYHKNKSHAQEFRNTKFIVFEEQTSPAAAPPENWVSFLSPKEETRIHKIISSPTPTPSTALDGDYTPSNGNIKNNRNKEFIEIDLESNTVLVAAADVSNNCFELNSALNPYYDVHVQQNLLLHSNDEPASTGTDLTDEKRGRNCSTRIKSTLKSKANSLKISKSKLNGMPNSLTSTSNTLQTEIQSPRDPYVNVYLKRQNLITIQNESSPSNCTVTIRSQQNDKSDRNHSNSDSDAKAAKQPKVNDADQENINKIRNSTISPSLTTVENCKFCSENFNSTVELYVHEHICRLKRQCVSFECVQCHLTLRSSDELNAHNLILHSTPETAQGQQTELVDDLEVATEKQSDFPSNICSSSSETNLPLTINDGVHVYKIDCNPDLDFDPVSNGDDDDLNRFPDPTSEVNLNCGDLLEVVKTEYIVAEANEDSEFPDPSDDPSESVDCRDDELEEEMFSIDDSPSQNSDEGQAASLSHKGFYCISCQKHFGHMQERKDHNKKIHETPDGKRRFECPHPNCETIVSSHYCLINHVQHVHSNMRPFNCPHPNCEMSFKTLNNRRSHVKLHTMDASRSKFECPYADCGKKTTSKFNLRSHIQQVHSNSRPYKCPYPNCTQSFKVPGGINRHLKRHAKRSTTM